MTNSSCVSASNARHSPLGKWRKSGVNGMKDRPKVKNGFEKSAVNGKRSVDDGDVVKDRNFNNEINEVPTARDETSSLAIGSKYDCFKRVKIVLLNECGIVYEHTPTGGHRGDVVKLDSLEEMVFGSVAINFVVEEPVFKIHQLSDVLMISLVLNVKRCTNSPRKESGNKTEDTMSLTQRTISRKWGLVVMFDTSCDVAYIREYILTQIHLMDCYMCSLRDDLLNALATKCNSLLSEGTKRFLRSVNNVLCAQILSTSVSLQSFAVNLIALIKQIDTKTTNFFLSKLISTLLIYKNRLNRGLQVIITCSDSKLQLMQKLLRVLRYFLQNYFLREEEFADPVITLSSCPPSGLTATKSPSRAASTSHLATDGLIVRKSRDESLGYGSLSDSETNVCQTTSECKDVPAVEENADSNPKLLNQSKLYIKEYQSLRFDKAVVIVEKPNDECKGAVDQVDSAPVVRKKISRSSQSSGCCDEYDLLQDMLECKECGIQQVKLPPLVPIHRPSSETQKISATLMSEPVITEVYLRHFVLQGIVTKKGVTFKEIVENRRCKCSQKAEVMINGDLENWSVNVTSLKSNTTVPAMMCTQIGTICDSLVALDAIDMKPEFIIGYLHCKLNELKFKSRILQSLQVDRCSLALKAQCILTDSANATFDTMPDLISPVMGFDVSDLPLLSVISTQQQSSHMNASNGKQMKQAETSL